MCPNINLSKFPKYLLDCDSSIGHLIFHHTSLKNREYLLNLLSDEIDSKAYTLKVMYDHLEDSSKANISISDFNNLSDEELDVIVNKFANNSFFETQFKSLTNGNCFDKFKSAIELSNKELLIYIKKLSESMTKLYVPLGVNIFEKLKGISDTHKKMDAGFASISNMYKYQQSWCSGISKNLEIFSNIYKQHENFYKAINSLKISPINFNKISKNCITNLKKGRWLITGNTPASFIMFCAKSKSKTDIRDLFIDYYLKNNGRVLKQNLNNWRKNPIFKKRVKILSDTTDLFLDNYKKSKTININNVVIPTLISQIEGIRTDYLRHHNIKSLPQNRWKNSKDVNCKSWQEHYREILAIHNQKDEFLDYSFKVFEDILYRPENKRQIVTFNRHTISHGKTTKYGKIETTIRCFMILEFLSELPI